MEFVSEAQKVLLGKRKGAHGEGQYAFPGGHLEYMESFENCAKRETKEECGIEIGNARFLYLSNLKNFAPKHYVQIGLIADYKSGEPEALEPDKCEKWDWYDTGSLPENVFVTVNISLDCFKNKINYLDN